MVSFGSELISTLDTDLVRIAFIYQFDDRDWLGGKNYFSSLFRAIHDVGGGRVRPVLVTGRKTETSLPDELPFLEVVRTPMLDRWSVQWVVRQAARKWTRRRSDPLLGALLERLNVQVLSHSEPLLRRGSRIRMVGWLPDFQFLHLPHLWSPIKTAYTRRAYDAVCERADVIIVSSAAALSDLKTFAPWFRGVSKVLHFVPSPVDIDLLPSRAEICRKYRLPEDYFHLPNQFWRHKNHGLVIDALAAIRERGENPPTIACTGHTQDIHSPTHFGDLMKRCEDAGVTDVFRVLGVVPYVDMQSLMLHSNSVLNPSRFEGWSTSVEEAKSIGKRLILSDIPVHREQAPLDAYYFGTDDHEGLAAALMRTRGTDQSGYSSAEVHTRYERELASFGRKYLDIITELLS